MTQVTQYGIPGGNAVAEKRVDFAYNPNGQFSTISRYADLAGTQLVAQSDYTFDNASRLTDLTYTKGATTLAGYSWTYDAANRITQFDSLTDGTASYTYDNTSQVTDADYSNSSQTDENYTFDSNGNRTGGSYSTYTDSNRLHTDAEGNIYEYDAEGNRTSKTSADGLSKVEYAWDNRNRLAKVTNYSRASTGGSWVQGKTVEYAYDVYNRLVGKTVDEDGNSVIDRREAYVYDGQNVAMKFVRDDSQSLVAGDLQARYLYGPAVDQVLAEEIVNSLSTPGEVRWLLADNQGTVRDLASYNSGTHTTTIANHRVYEAFGNMSSQTNAAVDCLFGFTGKPLDKDTGEQYNINRWYDSIVAGWLCQDPIGFKSGTTNLYCYCGNNPTSLIDPIGLSGDGYCHFFYNDYIGPWLDPLINFVKNPPPPPEIPPEVLPVMPGGEFFELLHGTPDLANAGTALKIRELWLDMQTNPYKYTDAQRKRINELYNMIPNR